MKEGKYIYAIIKETEDKSFGCIGINDQEVTLIPYKDIAAVVSNTPVINFDRLDKEILAKYIMVHQKVNEEIMRGYDIAPMSFGMIAPPSVDEVQRILEKACLQFKTALRNVAGKVEFAVQVWWNQKNLLEEIANTNPEIQKLKQEASLKASLLAVPIKLKLGKLVYKELETRRQTFINDIQESLTTLSQDFTFNKLIDDEMIANFSFLVERTRESELDKRMQELGKKYDGKLRFKYIGPMPPYSFVNINLALGNFEAVDEARKLLGVGEAVSFEEIKKAYYALSHRYHPDKRGGETDTAEKMKAVNKAYSILENYCESCDELGGGKKVQNYSFRKEDVENSLVKYLR